MSEEIKSRMNSQQELANVAVGTETAPAWRRYVHLYLPLLVSVLNVLFTLNGNPTFDILGNPGNIGLVLVLSAIPTYLLGSFVYPRDRPKSSSENYMRFTRKNDLYRVAVLFTYGRIYGTPFNLLFFIMDVIFSFAIDAVIGDKSRRSDFFIALLWVAGSTLVAIFMPYSVPILGTFLGMVDRTLWRSAYVALVDDVVGFLTRPNVQTLKGKSFLVLVQAFTITSVATLVFAKVRRPSEGAIGASYPQDADADPQ